MAEPTNPNPQETSKQERQVKNIWKSSRAFLRNLLDIRGETDHAATLEMIRADIPMKGHTAWILVCAIFIASIGLNVDSTAVVIGAMLISPLMGPIMGLGMGVAINDGLMLRRSLTNLGVMIGISVITSFIYFAISPIKELTPELDGRTWPTFLDVLIAISGGLALIIARSKKGTIMSVLVGVAIATALMPPLCTAGYGLARTFALGWTGFYYFLGAMYLFSINTVYIALSAYVIARVLKFPMAKYANQERRKKISRNATIVGLLALAPSIWTFGVLFNEQVFESDVKAFITNEIDYPGADVFKYEWDYEKQEIDVYLFGEVVPDNILNSWKDKLKVTEGLEETKLTIRQGVDQTVQASEIQTEYISNVKKLNNVEAENENLRRQIAELKNRGIPTMEVFTEAKPIFPNIKEMAIGQSVVSDFNQVDTFNVFYITYYDSIPSPERVSDSDKIRGWLEAKLQLDTLVLNVK